MKRGLVLATLVAMAAGYTGACAGPENATVTPAEPDRASFPPVEDLLVRRCGTLDCHGQVGRNLRLYGHEGLRLAPDASPNRTGVTTTEEYDASYRSVVALEPEILGEVVASGGAAPERLTLVRKARGTEHHKGGTLMNAGDPEDLCLTSWLAGKTDAATCQAALRSAF